MPCIGVVGAGKSVMGNLSLQKSRNFVGARGAEWSKPLDILDFRCEGCTGRDPQRPAGNF